MPIEPPPITIVFADWRGVELRWDFAYTPPPLATNGALRAVSTQHGLRVTHDIHDVNTLHTAHPAQVFHVWLALPPVLDPGDGADHGLQASEPTLQAALNRVSEQLDLILHWALRHGS